MLTAAGDAVDKVLGLVAPTTMSPSPTNRASSARCKSVLRRSANKTTPSLLERVRIGCYTLDLPKRQLFDQGGKDVD
jgi:two-component system OmpR family response regulator/two-component system phosphate regulon response regulator OmpR